MTLALVVGVAGSIGAISRYLLDGVIQDRSSGRVPYGTLTVNVVGSLIFGAVTAFAVRFPWASTLATVVAVGFCGALTTWSAVSWETVRLGGDGGRWLALRFVAASLVTSLVAAGVGYAIVRSA